MTTTGPGSGDRLPRPGITTTLPTPPMSSPGCYTDGDESAPKLLGCWELAFQRLSDKDRGLIEAMAAEECAQSFVSGMPSPTSVPQLEQLIELTKAKLEYCDKKAWKVPIPGGHQVILRDIAAKIVGWLDTFKAVGDTAVQYDPVSAALPWAAVRFFIQVAVNERDQMHHLLTVVEAVTRISSRCRVYELVYPPESLPEDSTRALHAIIKFQKMQEMVKEITDQEVALRAVTATCEAFRIANIDSISNELTQVLKRFEAPLARFDRKVTDLMEYATNEEQRELLEWISPVYFGSHHEEVHDLRTPDTCNWLLRDTQFKEWHSSSSSSCLLLYGIPGAGKTFLTSRVIDWVQETLSYQPSNEAFAYFYCKRDMKYRNDPVHVLRSYVRQLSTSADYSHPGYINKTQLVRDSSKPVKVFISSRINVDIMEHFKSTPTIQISATNNKDDIAEFVNTEIKKHPRWFRMPASQQEEIKSTLLMHSDGMFQWDALQIKQLLELRTASAIRDRIGKLPLTLKDAYDEIYLKIASLHAYEKQLAIRTFQWVMCARRPLTTEELLGAISVDPSLADVDIAALEIPEVDENDILEFCQSLVVYQHQPGEFGQGYKTWSFSHLSVIEYLETNHFGLLEAHCNAACTSLTILEAVFKGYSYEEPQRFEKEQPNQQYDYGPNPKATERMMEELLGLAFFPRKYGYTRKILRRNSGGLSYLQFDYHPRTVPKMIQDQLAPEFSSYARFTHYSMDLWWWHVLYVEREANSSVEPRLHHRLTSFLGHPSQGSEAYDAWIHYMPAMDLGIDTHEFFKTCWIPLVHNKGFIWNEPMRPLHLAGILSLRNLMSVWWNDPNLDMDQTMSLRPVSGTTRNSRPGHLETLWPLISIVAPNPNTQLLRHLVCTRGIDYACLDQPNEHVVTPLWAAAISTSPSPLRFLLQHVSDVHVNGPQTSMWPLPLGAAVCYGTEEAVQLLLEAGATPNLPATETKRYPNGEIFLGEAAQRRGLNIVKLLVGAGADVNADAGVEIGSALAGARTTEIQEFLISAGADVNKVLSGPFRSAIEAAAYGKSTGHVWRLLEAGADHSSPSCSRYSTPLTAVVVSVIVNTTFESHDGYCSALDACFHFMFRHHRDARNLEHFYLCYKWMDLLIRHGAVWRGRIEEWKSMAGARLNMNSSAISEDENDTVLWKKSWTALLARYQSTTE
ncbi:hypothetical protein CPLU01_11055 [Colletotrichum plurivorum]|uniref:Nephrocystin 3-like N-terminal domain-containing protein n=1 Tax=Colletotrichum plurivorum TaxID=2175906 RepID=A0A8H6N8F0_9PEZI|nr:hypothetical protein CPLU01_11055 [Colletotrichum plurivorum]